MENKKYKENFKNFMSSDKDYNLNKDYWRLNIKDLVSIDLDDWVLNNFGNGEEIKDGNPLFSCKLSNNKAIRIIQEKRNPYSPVFASWITNYEIEENKIEELVIAIQPYQETYNHSTILIKKYLENRYKVYQRNLNVVYNKKTNYNRINHLLKFLDNTSIRNNSWKIKRNEIISNNINHSLLKKINRLNQNLSFYESTFQNKSLKSSYTTTLKSIQKLNDIITLKYSYDLEEGFESEDYKRKIIKKYSNIYNYVKSYNKTVDNLEEKVEELKKEFEKTTHDKV